MNPHQIIKRPLITEKTTIQKELSNQVTFEVDRRANRVEIQKAIEELFNVGVARVRTQQVKGKVKRRGRIVSPPETAGRMSSSTSRALRSMA